MDAYARPIAAPEAALKALRHHAAQQHELLGAPEQVLWLSEQAPVRLQSLQTAIARAVATRARGGCSGCTSPSANASPRG